MHKLIWKSVSLEKTGKKRCMHGSCAFFSEHAIFIDGTHTHTSSIYYFMFYLFIHHFVYHFPVRCLNFHAMLFFAFCSSNSFLGYRPYHQPNVIKLILPIYNVFHNSAIYCCIDRFHFFWPYFHYKTYNFRW